MLSQPGFRNPPVTLILKCAVRGICAHLHYRWRSLLLSSEKIRLCDGLTAEAAHWVPHERTQLGRHICVGRRARGRSILELRLLHQRLSEHAAPHQTFVRLVAAALGPHSFVAPIDRRIVRVYLYGHSAADVAKDVETT